MREAFFGLSTDWKEGINWANVRDWRLKRAHEAMERQQPLDSEGKHSLLLAAAFSVNALERQKAAGIQPGSFPMPVLVQRALQPQCGGAAELNSSGTVVVHGVEGPAGPLLQGWVGGHRAHRSDGENGHWVPRGLQYDGWFVGRPVAPGLR